MLLSLMLAACSANSNNAQNAGASNESIAAPSTESGSSADHTAEEPSASGENNNSNDAAYVPPGPNQPGQLTEGRWDDLAHRNDWLNRMNEQRWDSYQNAWARYTQQLLRVHVTKNGEPLRDIFITVRDDRQTEWTARTNHKGEAFVFLFSQPNHAEEQGNAKYEVIAADGVGKQFENVQIGVNTELAVEWEADAPKPSRNVDLLLAVMSF